jgi:hypothetical protein
MIKVQVRVDDPLDVAWLDVVLAQGIGDRRHHGAVLLDQVDGRPIASVDQASAVRVLDQEAVDRDLDLQGRKP